MFFTAAYIVVVNPLILQDAGIPLGMGVAATIAASVTGCFLMAFWARVPVILVPGMGVNAFFSYSIVQSLGLSWREGLIAVIVAGALFILAAFSTLGTRLAEAVPPSLKHGITAGIGFFLIFIGLQKGELIRPSEETFLALGDIGSPVALSTIAGLVFTLILHVRNVRGSFLYGILFVTVLSVPLGLSGGGGPSLSGSVIPSPFFIPEGLLLLSLPFWVAVFSLTMIVVVENMGLLTGILPDGKRFTRAYQATAVNTALSGFLGTSPTIASAESASGIAVGGRTGLPALIAGVLFLGSAFFLPLLGWIPGNAAAPVLIVVGVLMAQSVAHLSFEDFTETFPAFLIIAGIPLTASIADGLAFGFIVYPLMKVARGRWRQVPALLYLISGLFLLNLIAMSIAIH